jgi:hypothetical protein
MTLPIAPELAQQLQDLIRPKVPAGWWGKSAKKASNKARIEVNHPYVLGRISDYDTEVTADETWLSGTAAASFPRLKPKVCFWVEVVPIGVTRLQVTILRKAPALFRDYLLAPTQAILEPREFEGKSFKIAQMPRRDNNRIVLRDTLETRKVTQNGLRWIEFDRPLEFLGNDLVAAFNDSRFGAK